MKTNHCLKVSLASSALVLICEIAKAQDFQNLDFSGGFNYVGTLFPVGDYGTIPGWTGYSYGLDYLSPYIFYNPEATELDSSELALFSNNGSPYLSMQANDNTPSQISQSGLIPVGTKSLIITANGYELNIGDNPPEEINQLPLQVSFGGSQLNLVQISATEYGADISGLAGQTGDLVLADNAIPHEGYINLSNIQFSDVAIPEPATYGLLSAVATIGVSLRFRNLRARAVIQ